MKIDLQGVHENNLKNLNLTFENGLSVVTGVSGSGKSSLVFNTLYHECRRRFIEMMISSRQEIRLNPAKVDKIKGLVPAIAIEQNILNRNPNSSLGTASGIHPFLRILLAKFGIQLCYNCKSPVQILSIDEIIEIINSMNKERDLTINTFVVRSSYGSHKTVINLLQELFPKSSIKIDKKILDDQPLNPNKLHDIMIEIEKLPINSKIKKIRNCIDSIIQLQSNNIYIQYDSKNYFLAFGRNCAECGQYIKNLEPKIFNQLCFNCNGQKCKICDYTGMNPQAISVKIGNKNIQEILNLSVKQAISFFKDLKLPSTASRLLEEINKRLLTLSKVDLEYIQLSRPSPSLSRGESQRVKLSNLLISELEDLLCVLDEPTIGLHPSDIIKLLPHFKELPGSVVFVEHDRLASAHANYAFDLGPGGGIHGGNLIFNGSVPQLWQSNTLTGQYYSKRKLIVNINNQREILSYFTIVNANFRNLKNITIKIPINGLTMICGVSGSGKTTLVRDVIVNSIESKKIIGCSDIKDAPSKVVFVNQNPIGKNSRSNPSTYTNLAKYIRKLYSENTSTPETYFSFNTKEGVCPECNGLGELEIKMKFLPSNWVQCASCDGLRFDDEILSKKINFGNKILSISDFYKLNIEEAYEIISSTELIPNKNKISFLRILRALLDIGLGYLKLDQPSPSLSGGESQRVKLTKYIGKNQLNKQLIVLDEPTTGLHLYDIQGLIDVLKKLIDSGATILIVEHNFDLIPFVDWIIELGPGSGEQGGQLIFSGKPSKIRSIKNSKSNQFIQHEDEYLSDIIEKNLTQIPKIEDNLIIKGAKANNLKNINLAIPKNQLVAITGVSGSGKSSLIFDVIETEGKKRFYETLSMYERQSFRETMTNKVDSISGMDVTLSLTPDIPRGFGRTRQTVGKLTEISYLLASIFSLYGSKSCPNCHQKMKKTNYFECRECKIKEDSILPKYFDSSTYGAACKKCQGLGVNSIPDVSKLIIDPKKSICGGAMYSPGYFPRGYYCKAPSWGKKMLDALADIFNFDPVNTPWENISEEGKQAFLFGLDEPLEIEGKTITFTGFYGITRNWDTSGTFTDLVECDECNGSGLRSNILEIKLANLNIYEIESSEIKVLIKILNSIKTEINLTLIKNSFETIKTKLEFLNKVGLGYITLNRKINTLSAGEAQRIKIARMLGSEFTNLLLILDEPSRGLHPMEASNLNEILHKLTDQGNTVLVVEHDPLFITNADYLIEIGPKSGVQGGEIVLQGSVPQIFTEKSITTDWISHKIKFPVPIKRRTSYEYISIKGARAYNLKNLSLKIPIHCITGICGVSGSGKSVLIVDTLSRALIKPKITTSIAQEEVKPGEYDKIENPLDKTILIDQSKKEIQNPGQYMGIIKDLKKIYSNSEEFLALNLNPDLFSNQCDLCKGRGYTSIDMGFLPNIHEECEICEGTGLVKELWDLKVNKKSLPELYSLTFKELKKIFPKKHKLNEKLNIIEKLGLDYLVLKQPAISLSGGEAQRLKIAKELSKKVSKQCLYIFDEPSVGLHLHDLVKLTNLFEILLNNGHTIIVIEHNPEILAFCDYLFELGPEGGKNGGYLVAEGTPEEIANSNTPSSKYLMLCLEENK